MFRFALVVLLVFTYSPLNADSYADSPSCSKPFKPSQFSDEDDYENFLSEVRDYKQCIMDFIEEQNEAIRTHQKAAQNAIDEWDDFVTFELN